MELKATYVEKQSAEPKLTKEWVNHFLSSDLYYSHRDNVYTPQTYPGGYHYHDFHEVDLILGGDVCYHSDAASYAPVYGDVIVIPAGKLHATTLTAEQTRYVRFKYYLYDGALETFGASSLLEFLHKGGGEPFFFSLPQHTAKELEALHQQLDRAVEKSNEKDHALAMGLILQIFYLLDRYATSSVFSQSDFPPKLVEVQQFLGQHYAEQLSVDMLAERFYYSRGHLSRLFRQYFHLTIGEYLLKLRVNAGKKLMEEPLSLAEICFQCGFGSLSSFIRAFHEETGMTPSQFRKKLKEF